jgi:NAD(P)-dependent dehydrogenase (short-subunit alcohol dehydrogenase family)
MKMTAQKKLDEFTGKSVIVTGASEGIGRALCLALAPQRPKLTLAARNEKRLAQLKGEVEALGAEALVVSTDVGDREQCRALVEAAVEKFGALDVLVNNAGMGQWTLFEQIDDLAFYEDIMRINFLSGVYCTHYALPHIKKTGGRIAAVAIMLCRQWVAWIDPKDDSTAERFDCLGFADLLCDVHDESCDWEDLRMLLKLSGEGATGYGIRAGGAIRIDPGGAIEIISGKVDRIVQK